MFTLPLKVVKIFFRHAAIGACINNLNSTVIYSKLITIHLSF